MRVPDPKANTTTEAYLAYKAGFLEESELKPILYEPYLHFDAWLAYWAGLTNEYPLDKNGDPEMLTDEEALVAYLSGVTDTYPQEIKDPYDVRIVGYLKHLASVRWPEPDYPVNNEEFYLSTMEPTHTSNSEPSSNIELDTAEGKIIGVEAYGDTKQQTYSGKNMLNVDFTTATKQGITFTNNGDSTITISGTPQAASDFPISPSAISLPITLTSGKNYTQRLEIISGSLGGMSLVPAFKNSQGTISYNYFTNNSTRTPSETLTCHSYNLFWGPATVGTAINVTIRVWLEEGSDTSSSFEPYTGGIPAPNPDYPQEVQTVTGEQTVTVTGKNLFDKVAEVATSPNYSLNPDGTITTNASNAQTGRRYMTLTMSPGTYTLSFRPYFSGVENPAIRFTIRNMDTSTDYIVKNINNPENGSLQVNSFTVENTTSVGFCIIPQARLVDGQTFYFDDTQLEEGSTATAYEPYQSQSYTIDLGSIELCKIGTYQDYIYQSEGDWYVHKDMGKQVLNGTENIYNKDTSSGFTRVYFPLTGQVNVGNMRNVTLRSDYFNASVDNNYGTAFLNNARTYVYPQSTITTVEEFKTWLSSNNTTFYYPLATPTDTKITDATLIGQLEALAGADTYNEKTYIKVTANDPNLPALLKVEAYKY